MASLICIAWSQLSGSHETSPFLKSSMSLETKEEQAYTFSSSHLKIPLFSKTPTSERLRLTLRHLPQFQMALLMKFTRSFFICLSEGKWMYIMCPAS